MTPAPITTPVSTTTVSVVTHGPVIAGNGIATEASSIGQIVAPAKAA